jgi:hypothetical protein
MQRVPKWTSDTVSDSTDPIGEALRNRPQRYAQHSDHWRRRQAAQQCASPAPAIDPLAATSSHAQHASPQQDVSALAWSIWRHERAGWLWNAAANMMGGISLPSAREMQLLFGTRHDSLPASPYASPRAASPRRNGGLGGGLSPLQGTSHSAGRSEDWRAPIVILHGVGLGVMPYLAFIHKVLCVFGDTPVIVPEVRRVTMHAAHASACRTPCHLASLLRMPRMHT